jgi:hypothetical protein
VRDGGRFQRSSWAWAYLQRRRTYLWIAVVLGVTVAFLLWISRSLPEYGKNLGLNLGADLIGTIVVLFAISPFLARAETQRDSVRENFDRGGFIKNVADARGEILILELWTDLLQGGYRTGFIESLRAALRQQVKIRILLLSPDARAAEQRADELLQQTNVVADILDNLRILYDFVYTEIPEVHRRNIDIRVYSALPPVQMYQVDSQVIVSFYPVNVTSWNATQYLTSPDSQLGKFVGDKFDELWKARSTRTLEQFWETTVVVGAGAEEKSYRVGFVMSGEDFFISGQRIVADNAENGIAGLSVQTITDNVTGEPAARGPFSLAPIDMTSETEPTVRGLFQQKYGQDHHVILRLVEE